MVWMTRPIAPSAISLPATMVAGTTKRSEKQIENSRPVRATAASTAASWSKLVTPGLSTITSLPASIAANGDGGAVAGDGGAGDQVDRGVVEQRLARARRKRRKALAETREHAFVAGRRIEADAGRAGLDQPAHHVEDVAVVQPYCRKAHAASPFPLLRRAVADADLLVPAPEGGDEAFRASAAGGSASWR